jgi:hypothetical protein
VELFGHTDVDLANVFAAHPGHYLEHMLVHLLPSEIRSVEVERKGALPFRFTMDSAGELEATLNGMKMDPAQMDELAVRLLFSYFTAIRYEDKASTPGDAPPAGKEDTWMATLRVESVRGEHHHLSVHSLPVESPSDRHLFQALVYYNKAPEPLIVKYIYLDVLMRGAGSYFGDNP